MFHSPAGWQTKPKALSEFEKLTSKSSKLAALKDQIRIRVLGFGWEDLHYARGVRQRFDLLLLWGNEENKIKRLLSIDYLIGSEIFSQKN